jgi:hypothetical protein
MNLRIKITLEKKRLLRLRRTVKTTTWCNECGRETEFVPEKQFDEISAELGFGRQPHKIPGPDGSSLICLESLQD